MLGWAVETTLVAAGLATLATLAGRSRRGTPEARHALWLVVLLRFLIPPLVAWPWALGDRPDPPEVAMIVATRADVGPMPPRPAPAEPVPAVPVAVAAPVLPEPSPPSIPPVEPEPEPEPEPARSAVVALGPTPPAASPTVASDPAAPAPGAPAAGPPLASIRLDWRLALLAGWLVGAVVASARAASRVARFRRTLRLADPAPGWLVVEVAAVAARLGVRRPPPTLVVAGLPTPLLWCLGRPRLVLPTGLERMTPAARAGLLAHELAHLARRDHWVVRLELLAGLIWWWNPIYRLAARRLRDAAEAACDARVVRACPEHRFAYAEALVEVCASPARPAPPLPALGIGGPRAARTLEARLCMILRDPIRPRSRRLAPLALALLALASPAWTAGQQAPAPPPRPAGPAVAPPEPGAEPPAATNPPAAARPSPWTIDQIRRGFLGRRRPDRALAFRCVVARREVNWNISSRVDVVAADVVLGRRSPAGDEAGAAPAGPPAPDRVGDAWRFDLVEALDPARPAAAAPGPAPNLWRRRFLAQDRGDLLAFEADPASPPAVEFRSWPATTDRNPGDVLALTIRQAPGVAYRDEGATNLDPIRPRPQNQLDLVGGVPMIFDPQFATLIDPVEVEVVDGVETARVAWEGKLGGAVRGVCWVAPGYDFAVVRVEAETDSGIGSFVWRKAASDWAQVGGLWLPGRIRGQLVPRTLDAQNPVVPESVMTFEDYRVDPPVTAETFRPPSRAEGVAAEGDGLATIPPEVPSGLVARLGQAVAASPFGPPGLTQPSSPALAALEPADPFAAPAPPPAALFRAQAQLRFAEAKVRRFAVLNAKIPNTVSKEDVAQAEAERQAGQAQVDAAQGRPAPADPQVAQLRAEVERLKAQLAAASKPTERQPADPTRQGTMVLKARRDAQAAEVEKAEARRDRTRPSSARADALLERNAIGREEYDQIKADFKVAEAEVAGQRAKLVEADALLDQSDMTPAAAAARPVGRDPVGITILRARRDAQAAEVAKAQARRDHNRADLTRADSMLQRNSIGREEYDRIKAAVEVAEPELAGQQAKLAEADALLGQANQHPAPARPAERESGNLDILRARRDAQAAEVEKAEAARDRTRHELDNTQKLANGTNPAVSQWEVGLFRDNLRIAEAEVAGQRAKLVEADAIISQARLAPVPAAERATMTADRPTSLADYRDLVELAEMQVQLKRAELQRAEGKLERLGKHVELRSNLVKEGRITQREWLDIQTERDQAQDDAKAKGIEVREAELRLKQASRRADAVQARLKRLREEWERTEELYRIGEKTTQDLNYARDRYEDLMFQFDPNGKLPSEKTGQLAPLAPPAAAPR